MPAPDAKPAYFPASPHYIIPATSGRFEVFLKQGDAFMLFSTKADAFTEELKEKLMTMGVEKVWIKAEDMRDFRWYLNKHLATILEDDAIPLEDRSRAWYESSLSLIKNVFEEKLPKGLGQKRFKEIADLVRQSAKFFLDKHAIRQLSGLVGRGSSLYDHSLGVMVLTAFVLKTLDKPDPVLLEKVCLGAILHDAGKARIPQHILEKRTDALLDSDREFLRSHPVLGVGLCSTLPLAQESINCILFHHEREDGRGYPSALAGEEIPLYVKAVCLCNDYDSLTRTTPDHTAMTPFQALKTLKDNKDAYDLDMLKRLILVLADAKLT